MVLLAPSSHMYLEEEVKKQMSARDKTPLNMRVTKGKF
jgi:hypothetical protein